MTILAFPPVEQADENGLLAFGGDLEIESLRLAYSQGIFPWPIGSNYPLAWFSPDPRGILTQEHLYAGRSLKKIIRQKPWRITFNQCFETVIRSCAHYHAHHPTAEQGTWITAAMINAYVQFHHAGHAFSTEVWLDDELVGGLYGVRYGRALSGESMFHRENNASKIALIGLMTHLARHQIGWLDTQMVTNVVGALGAIEIERRDFLAQLYKVRELDGGDIFTAPPTLHTHDLLQHLD